MATLNQTKTKLNPGLKRLIIYIIAVTVASIGYFFYALSTQPATVELETFMSEIGEGVGTLAMWALFFIYLRTALKLFMGKGPISKRLLPDYSPPASASVFKKLLAWLDRTHVHVGIATVAIVALHIVLMGAPISNLFFLGVIVLIVWQTLFGLFLRWRSAPRDIKKFSYSVHAQLVTGVMLGIFAYFGHLLIDN